MSFTKDHIHILKATVHLSVIFNYNRRNRSLVLILKDLVFTTAWRVKDPSVFWW